MGSPRSGNPSRTVWSLRPMGCRRRPTHPTNLRRGPNTPRATLAGTARALSHWVAHLGRRTWQAVGARKFAFAAAQILVAPPGRRRAVSQSAGGGLCLARWGVKLLDMLCIYCQAREAETEDHVPPQCLFPGVPPSTLIAVPACWPCNNGASKEDEYFKWYMASRKANETNPLAMSLLPSVLRGLNNPMAEGFANRIRRNIRPKATSENTAADLEAYIDHDCIGLVVKRTVAGLHFRRNGAPLRKDCPLICQGDGAYSPSRLEDDNKTAGILAAVAEAPLQTVVPHAFAFRVVDFADDERAVWLLRFFDQSWFVVYVGVESPAR
jgi:hypothetical protein